MNVFGLVWVIMIKLIGRFLCISGVNNMVWKFCVWLIFLICLVMVLVLMFGICMGLLEWVILKGVKLVVGNGKVEVRIWFVLGVVGVNVLR